MRHGAAFAEILDEQLKGYDAVAPGRAAQTGSRRTTGPSVFFFDPALKFSTIPYAAARQAYGIPASPPPFTSASETPAAPPPPFMPDMSDRPATPVTPAAPRVRPRRTLSPRQQQALGQLVELGGSIGADFTDRELRSMFRALARRYHPDRHPGVSEPERARLSRQFARLHDAYNDLQIVPAAAA